jgi:hypothetical protein
MVLLRKEIPLQVQSIVFNNIFTWNPMSVKAYSFHLLKNSKLQSKVITFMYWALSLSLRKTS